MSEREKWSLLIASMKNDTSMVRNLLCSYTGNMNFDRDERGRTPMHMAAMRGNVEMLELLYQHGGKLGTVDLIGNTLMHMCNHVDVLQFLVDHGLSATERNINGDTPLVLAMRFAAKSEVCRFLKELEQKEMLSKYTSAKDMSSWEYISAEFGPYRILVVLLFIALLSLYITYIIIGDLPSNSQTLEHVLHQS